jgi:hypothetical protein
MVMAFPVMGLEDAAGKAAPARAGAAWTETISCARD